MILREELPIDYTPYQGIPANDEARARQLDSRNRQSVEAWFTREDNFGEHAGAILAREHFNRMWEEIK